MNRQQLFTRYINVEVKEELKQAVDLLIEKKIEDKKEDIIAALTEGRKKFEDLIEQKKIINVVLEQMSKPLGLYALGKNLISGVQLQNIITEYKEIGPDHLAVSIGILLSPERIKQLKEKPVRDVLEDILRNDMQFDRSAGPGP